MSEKTLKEMNLEELDVRGAELRSALSELSEGERSDENGSQIRKLVDEVNLFDAVYTLARAKAASEQLRAAGHQAGPRGANGGHGIRGAQSIGERIMNHEAMLAFVERGMRSGTDGQDSLVFTVDGTVAGVRATTVSEFGAGGPGNAAGNNTNALLAVGQPIAPIPRQARLAMRDLIPSTPTTLAQVPYVRELSPTASEFGASAVAEGNVKPDGSLNFQGQNAPVTVIAVNLSPTKQLWEDAPLVVAYINQRLPYLVRFKEDAEFINGSGTWPDIQGLRQAPGKQTQTAVSGEFAQTIGQGIGKIENADGTATGVVLNPTDAWAMFTKRASGGSGTFDAGAPFSVSAIDALTVWGLPTVRSRAYSQGSALVGDYAHGAMILDREGVNIAVYPQHSDYAARNQVLVQCEERAGLAIWRPDLFVDCTLA